MTATARGTSQAAAESRQSARCRRVVVARVAMPARASGSMRAVFQVGVRLWFPLFWSFWRLRLLVGAGVLR